MTIYLVKMEYPINFGTITDSVVVGAYTEYKDAENLVFQLSRTTTGRLFITVIDSSAVEMIKSILKELTERKEE